MTAKSAEPESNLLKRRLEAFSKVSARTPDREPEPVDPNDEEEEEDKWDPMSELGGDEGEDGDDNEEHSPGEELEEPEDEEPESDEEYDDEDERLAAAALLRSGFTRAEVNAMERSNMIERGLRRHEILARDDAAYSRLKALGGPQKETAEESEESELTEPSDLPSIDFKGAVAPFAETYGLDGDAADALVKTLETTISPLVDYLKADRKERLQDKSAEMAVVVEAARKEIARVFPDLKKDRVFNRALQRAVRLQGDPAYAKHPTAVERMKAVLRDSARSLNLEAKEPAPGPRKAGRKVRNATPTAPREREGPKDMTLEESRWAAFRHLNNHKGDIQGARRAAGIG